jgi:methylmalonyl-CoA/ethylmalonyl-CoA epimerase
MKLAHIGIAVRSLTESVPVFENLLGVKASKQEFVEEQKVNVRKFYLENCEIELLESTSPDSPIAKFLEKKGEGIHHISFETTDIKKELQKAKENNIELINEEPRTGADDMLIAFLHPRSTAGILMELTQKKQ